MERLEIPVSDRFVTYFDDLLKRATIIMTLYGVRKSFNWSNAGTSTKAVETVGLTAVALLFYYLFVKKAILFVPKSRVVQTKLSKADQTTLKSFN